MNLILVEQICFKPIFVKFKPDIVIFPQKKAKYSFFLRLVEIQTFQVQQGIKDQFQTYFSQIQTGGRAADDRLVITSFKPILVKFKLCLYPFQHHPLNLFQTYFSQIQTFVPQQRHGSLGVVSNLFQSNSNYFRRICIHLFVYTVSNLFQSNSNTMSKVLPSFATTLFQTYFSQIQTPFEGVSIPMSKSVSNLFQSNSNVNWFK